MHNLAITVDMDWAPDWSVEALMGFFIDNSIRSTWFVTHDTKLLSEMRKKPELFELGIHPNFLPNSSHGDSIPKVLETCMAIVPEALTMRTHCLIQSTPIFQAVVEQTPIKVDTSIYLRNELATLPSKLPLDKGKSIWRLPFVWEDDLEFFSENPFWDAEHFLQNLRKTSSITVLDLHPIHFSLNSSTIANYVQLKSATSNMTRVSGELALGYANEGPGTATFMKGIAQVAKKNKGISFEKSLLEICEN